jgi:hypothetical protein
MAAAVKPFATADGFIATAWPVNLNLWPAVRRGAVK